jgi:hypothetical protein
MIKSKGVPLLLGVKVTFFEQNLVQNARSLEGYGANFARLVSRFKVLFIKSEKGRSPALRE